MSQRLAVDNFTFSSGTFIPKHTLFGVAGRAINTDEVKVEQKLLSIYCSDVFPACLLKSSRVPGFPVC